MAKNIGIRLVISVIATVLFSYSLALIAYDPIASRLPGHEYTSLGGLFVIYAIYSGPVFFLGGTICSFLIDTISSELKTAPAYIVRLIMYSLAGILCTYLFAFIISKGGEIAVELASLLLLGTIASLLYLHIVLIYEYIQRRNRMQTV